MYLAIILIILPCLLLIFLSLRKQIEYSLLHTVQNKVIDISDFF